MHGKQAMAFRRSDLQEAFFVPGTHAFRVWGYGTADPLDEVLAPGYFALARALLRPGELVYVSSAPPRGDGPERGHVHLALVMVRAAERGADRADGSVRLIQDFGGPGDVAAPACAPLQPMSAAPVPIKRGRGRPPGSRTKKAA
jgi:hypothetical protein